MNDQKYAPMSLDEIKQGIRRQYFDSWKWPDGLDTEAHILNERNRLGSGYNLSPEFLCELQICTYTYSLQLNDSYIKKEQLNPEDVRRIACHYMVELVYLLFEINLQDPNAWVGISALQLVYYSMVILNTRNSTWYQAAADATAEYNKSLVNAPGVVHHEVESEIKPVLTEKSKSRLGRMLSSGRKKDTLTRKSHEVV